MIKSPNFGTQRCKYADMRGGGGRVRDQKSIKIYFYCIFFCVYNNRFSLRFYF